MAVISIFTRQEILPISPTEAIASLRKIVEFMEKLLHSDTVFRHTGRFNRQKLGELFAGQNAYEQWLNTYPVLSTSNPEVEALRERYAAVNRAAMLETA